MDYDQVGLTARMLRFQHTKTNQYNTPHRIKDKIHAVISIDAEEN